jgi:hypothetical protein
MFGGKTKTPADQHNLGLRSRQLATNEMARPLAWFGGTQRMGSTYLGEPFGWNSRKFSSGNYVYASWALMFCKGRIDKIYKMIWDDELKWEGELTGGATWSIGLPRDQGTGARVHMGTDTATQDVKLAVQANHPHYRNQVYVVFDNVFLGVNRNTLPNVEFIFGRWPKPSWWTAPVDGAGYPKIGTDINPVAFIAELLEDPIFGLGLDASRIDTASFNAVATTLANEGIGISPLIPKRMGLKQILAEIFAIVDAHLYPLANGKIGLSLIRSPGGGLTLLDESKWVGSVELDPEGWAETVNALNVAFSNAELDYITDAAQFIDRGNYEITGVTRTANLQRPWITSQALAQKVALSNGARLAMPQVTGSLKSRKSVAKNLFPGVAFQLTCPDHGLVAVTARVKEHTLPAPKGDPEVLIRFELDRSYLNADYYNPALVPPGTAAAADTVMAPLVMEWPWMREHATPKILALPGRLNPAAVGFFAHRARPSGSYDPFGYSQDFGLHGQVVEANYPATTNVIDGGLGLVVQFDTVDQTIDNVPLADALLNEWLVMVNGEICSAFGATLLAAAKYRLFLVRGRFDTVREAHAIGDHVWVARRRDMTFFDALDEMEQQSWKLQRMLGVELEDLAGVAASVVNTNGRFWRPLEPANVRVFGDKTNPTYSTGQDVLIEWDVRCERMAGYWEMLTPGWSEDLPDTVLEFWTVGGGAALMHTLDMAVAPAGSFIGPLGVIEVLNANLVAWLGAEVSFEVRAYHRRDGFRSTRYSRVVVTKV